MTAISFPRDGFIAANSQTNSGNSIYASHSVLMDQAGSFHAIRLVNPQFCTKPKTQEEIPGIIPGGEIGVARKEKRDWRNDHHA